MALCGTEGRDEGGGEEGIKFRKWLCHFCQCLYIFLDIQASEVYQKVSKI